MRTLCLALAAVLLGSCSKGDDGGKARVAFANATFADPWRRSLNEMTRAEAEKHKDRIVLEMSDGQDDNARQISQIETYIQTGVKALIVSPNEAAALTPVVEKAYQKGIFTIVIDRAITNDSYHCFIGASNVDIGKAAGEYVAERLGGKGTVAEIQGTEGASATLDRHAGFVEAISKHPDIRIVASQHALYKRDLAMNKMADILQAHPKIDCVYSHNDEMAIGAWRAAEAARREKEMVFVGIDGQQSCIDMIREGKIHATFDYPRPGPAAVEVALKLLRGETVPKTIVLPTVKITKENAGSVKGF